MSKQSIGDILLELEAVIDKMADSGLQWGDIIGLVYFHLMIHRPDAQEEYTDGSKPELYYGPKNEK